MKNIVRPQSIGGFPEYTPQQQLVARAMLNGIRTRFELHGFTPIETPAVERLEVLLAKGGDTDKEMYLLQRMDPNAASDKEAELGLHYDLTVPFARYVAQHFGQLSFPFKRYQIQHCWRGERPQDGRFRQFLQCDLDVVSVDKLALSFDSEIPLVACEILDSLDIGRFQFRVSNRKILEGFLAGLGVGDIPVTLITRWLDKLEKIGPEKVTVGLTELGLEAGAVELCLQIAGIHSDDLSFAERVQALGVKNERLDLGLQELTEVIQRLQSERSTGFTADLSVTRGLDYYTGSVYEIRWLEHPTLGSIGAGGRYDDLASHYTNQKLPGVGLSLGFSRIFSKLISSGKVPTTSSTPTVVMVTWLEEAPEKGRAMARQLRARGIPTEFFYERAKLVKQLNYANKKGIPYVLFEADSEIKNMISGEQVSVDLATWSPSPSSG
jgi:histidyl-tRNA synthetase